MSSEEDQSSEPGIPRGWENVSPEKRLKLFTSLQKTARGIAQVFKDQYGATEEETKIIQDGYESRMTRIAGGDLEPPKDLPDIEKQEGAIIRKLMGRALGWEPVEVDSDSIFKN